MEQLEKYFDKYRKNIIGHDVVFQSPYGTKDLIYADWVASGRLYKPIEDRIINDLGPFVGNTHTESTETGTLMTLSYHHAHKRMKQLVNAGPEDVIITAGSGMTTVVNKLQRMLSLKFNQNLVYSDSFREEERPVVFITHMEHHSNHTSWYETIADVVLLTPDKDLLIDLNRLEKELKKYQYRKFKIGAFTACSNVTGIETPYHDMAKIMHKHGGICFVDFAASAPYVNINMHPDDPEEKLDAIYFSPHKFLGGPGSSGVIIFDKSLYHNDVPDNPGGGTVDWTNPWGEYKYVDDIEVREDGGTPGFLQAIKATMAMELKENMGVGNILAREKEQIKMVFNALRKIPGIRILADNVEDRLGIISFYHTQIQFNLFVKLLNDKFGIQMRGGCACAGTYGHFLLEVSHDRSKEITDLINHGDLSEKPGWIRWSLHPTTTDLEIKYTLYAIEEIVKHHTTWAGDYIYISKRNEYIHKDDKHLNSNQIREWFKIV
ncbi:MAG: aminotransferase class V-fold PLP-dependent enzyme [Bacteroidota bacterium]